MRRYERCADTRKYCVSEDSTCYGLVTADNIFYVCLGCLGANPYQEEAGGRIDIGLLLTLYMDANVLLL